MLPGVARKRQSIRLKGYDYRDCGAYFVTICTAGREPLFGSIVGGQMRLTNAGRILVRIWARCVNGGALPAEYDFMVMPNHVHGVAWLPGIRHAGARWDVGARRPGKRKADSDHPMSSIGPLPVDLADASPLRHSGIAARTLGAKIGAFKSQSAHAINGMRRVPGHPVWQRGYYERIIRANGELARVRQYILDNPVNWAGGSNGPERMQFLTR